MATEDVKPITVRKLPLILNRNIINKRNIKVVKSITSQLQEDIIYTSKPGDFTAGEVRRMTIVNRLNVSTNSSVTIAKCQSHSGHIFEKTSEEITKLIGQQNYDILFSSLCSVISLELKVRGINALLTVPKKNNSVTCQTETNAMSFSVLKNMADMSCQTPESWLEKNLISFESVKKPNPLKRRNRRQQLAPYVVKDTPEVKQPRRIVISPNNFNKIFKEESITQPESPSTEASLPELGSIFNEDSNNSVGRFSSLSVMTTPELLDNPLNILTNVDKHTRQISDNVNQREIEAKGRFLDLDSPEDLSPTNEKVPFRVQGTCGTPPEQRIRMLLRQGLNDLKDCLNRDADGYLPIHVAVRTNDVDLLRRQCLVLKMRGADVDVPADGLTPLRMSLDQENTGLTADLLHFGADPLDSDDDDKTAFHIAAQKPTDHLQILINHCQRNARKILQDNEQIWNPSFAFKGDEELAPILLTYINKLYDNQGYTPLMLASKVGKYNNVMTLVESCRATVNLRMPTSGNTALYLAVSSACMDAAERGNKAKIVDHFSKTVEILVENGADPGIENFAGSSVNDLLTEFNIAELSMLIANKLTSIRYFDGQLPNGIKGSDFMLFKDDHGKVNLLDMKEEKGKKPVKDTPAKPPAVKSPPKPVPVVKTPVKTNVTKPTITKTKSSPIIIENVEYKPLVKVNNPTSSNSKQEIHSLLKPVKVGTLKVENVSPNGSSTSQNFKPMVKNFKLNKPLIITSEVKNNKRKLDIIVDSGKSKKSNKND
ncbi:hypothetical protein PYW07_011272 [Mythimna separata]|uniref:Uncharacterized protein n=1 Tax=Mythimna separata TaxID=271217 RepID=A0AAD8DLU8_MYTSE|nr:hypothetical protein PYW07_011272 [Mythimna separata]